MSRAEEGIKLRAASIAVHSGCLDLAEVLLTPLLEACRGGAGGGGGGGGGSGGGGGAGIGGGGGPSLSLASQLPVMQAVTQLHVAQVGALGRRVCDRKVLVASAGRVTSLWHEGHPTSPHILYARGRQCHLAWTVLGVAPRAMCAGERPTNPHNTVAQLTLTVCGFVHRLSFRSEPLPMRPRPTVRCSAELSGTC